jgi:hypothetical protein
VQDKSKKEQKVLFIRVDEPIYKAVAQLADAEDRSINSMATRLLKSAIERAENSSKN